MPLGLSSSWTTRTPYDSRCMLNTKSTYRFKALLIFPVNLVTFERQKMLWSVTHMEIKVTHLKIVNTIDHYSKKNRKINFLCAFQSGNLSYKYDLFRGEEEEGGRGVGGEVGGGRGVYISLIGTGPALDQDDLYGLSISELFKII